MEMSEKTVYKNLNKTRPGVIVLFDPDRMPPERAGEIADYVSKEGAVSILIGSSLLVTPHFDDFIKRVKKNTDKPLILFPGCAHQVSCHADAIFFLSLLSGRNSEFLIGEQVKAVFLIKEYRLEVIPVGYILIESGNYTAVEYMSNTRPIPRAKTEIAVAHALTGEYFGMKYIYLEAGSGAKNPVPAAMIREVKKAITIPLIVGGGIRTADEAKKIIEAGADFIVLGSIIEKSKEQFTKIMRSLS
jgi:phosphoglycerol geranylgeranyltransferase